MKPIDTKYNGRRYRSRLEARWAVGLDAMGVPYNYEPEGYDTDHGVYLPDFEIRWDDGHTMFLEIKPNTRQQQPPEDRWVEIVKSGLDLFVAYGIPEIRANPVGAWPNDQPSDGFPASDCIKASSFWKVHAGGEMSGGYFFCVCPYDCGTVKLMPYGLIFDVRPLSNWERKPDTPWWPHIEFSLSAMFAAVGTSLESKEESMARSRAFRKMNGMPQFDECGCEPRKEENIKEFQDWVASIPEIKTACCGKKWEYPTPFYTGTDPRILACYDKARMARFEFGENG